MRTKPLMTCTNQSQLYLRQNDYEFSRRCVGKGIACFKGVSPSCSAPFVVPISVESNENTVDITHPLDPTQCQPTSSDVIRTVKQQGLKKNASGCMTDVCSSIAGLAWQYRKTKYPWKRLKSFQKISRKKVSTTTP